MLAVDSRTALQNYSIGLPLTRRTQYSIIFIRSAKTGGTLPGRGHAIGTQPLLTSALSAARESN